MANTTRFLVLAVLIGGMGGLSGCGIFYKSTQKPNILHPGTVQQQRLAAVAHDPYADPDIAPANAGGMRPRDFQKPLAEPVRNRWLSDSWWGR